MSATSVGVVRWWKDPWRKPRILQGLTWGYLVWSIVPVLIAVAFSFNAGRSRSTWQGFSFRWWVGDPSLKESLLYSPDLRAALIQTLRLGVVTMVVSVFLGTAFAIGLDRWPGRGPGTANFVMLLSFVIPEIILGVSLFLFFTYFLSGVIHYFGTGTELLGLITFQISYPVIIVRARILSIGREYEEAAMDLGGSPTQAVRRVLLPLLYPAIFASAVLVFADTIDDFVTVNYLSGGSGSEPLSVKIYDAARSAPTPAVNAAATFMLVATLIATGVGVLAYRRISRGQRTEGATKELVGFQV
jgi:spermidine/putrescine transport system permease protein